MTPDLERRYPRRLREAMLPNCWEEDALAVFEQLPLDVLLRMMAVVGPAGFADDVHKVWNGLVWELAILHGSLWESV